MLATTAFLLSAQLAGVHASSQEASPCADLEALEGSEYAYRRRGDRCEGLYDDPAAVVRPQLKVVGLEVGGARPDYAWAEHLRLEVPAWGGPEPVRLTARHVDTHCYYQMDALVDAGATAFDWSTDVIRALGYGSGQVKVAARLELERERMLALNLNEPTVHLPVRVDGSDGGGDEAASSLLFWFHLNEAVQDLRVKLFDLEAPSEPLLLPDVSGSTDSDALQVELPLGSLRPGAFYRLEIRSGEKGGPHRIAFTLGPATPGTPGAPAETPR